MPKGSYGLTPHQQANQRKSLEDIIAQADALPKPITARTVDDMQVLVKKLRDEKGLGWKEIEEWMCENTEFYRSGTFWKGIYNGKRLSFVKIERAVTPTLQQLEQSEITE